MATKLNVNIRTLLTNCEDLAKSEDNFWRLQKFLKSLSIMISELEAMAEWVVDIVQWNKQLTPPPNPPLYLRSPQSATRIPGYKERLAVLQQQTGYTNTATVNGNGSSSDVALQEMRQLQNTAKYNELRRDLLQGRVDYTLSLSLSFSAC